jgi:glycosyltransferase involved in cell wall biosynthesis
MKFSVLMSIYHKEKSEYFNRAMQSIWDEQTIRPNEIVLVQDGKLTDELYKSIEYWQVKIGGALKTVSLDRNLGLGDALNIGLEKCSYELVARMDTDDVCNKKRFEKQLKVFQDFDVDVCSSWVSEFDINERNIISYRKIPEGHSEIIKLSKVRCPVNHPATMYKKSAVQDVESYKKMLWFEDYYLWARMILNGAKFFNIQEPLVNMRAGYSMLGRRGGVGYAISEIKLQYKFLKMGFISNFIFVKNILIRTPVRLLPNVVRSFIYKIVRIQHK